jgi:carboxyl-terminal processing protease
MNKYIKLIILILLFKVCPAQQIGNTISPNEKLFHLSTIWSEIKYNFVNMDQVSFNVDSLYRAYIPKIYETKNDYEFYQLIKKFTATFKDGHTEVWDNGMFYKLKDYFTLNLINIDEKVYVVTVRKIPENDSSWVGAEVVKISNIPTKQFLQDSIFPYVSASTRQHLWMQGVSKIHSDFRWKNFRAKLVLANGDSVDINLPRNGESTRTPDDQYWGIQFERSRDLVSFKMVKDSIGYLNIKSFWPEETTIKLIDQHINGINQVKGLVIDLRKNGGGSTVVAWHLQSLLTKGNYLLNYSWETRINDGVKKANANWKAEYKDFGNSTALSFYKPDTIFIPDTIKKINVPVAVLIGNYTFSAAEDFLVNIYETPQKPILIGDETGGSTGSPLVVNGLPNEGIVRICTRRICFPYSGKRFVRSGIKPDIKVTQTIHDLIEGKDIVLDKAIEVLNESAKKVSK